MKIYVVLLSFIGTVVVAINIGSRIPPDTIAMTIGVALGALTTIPISLLLGMLIARRSQAAPQVPDEMPRPFAAQPPYPRLDGYASSSYASSLRNYPPVVIVNPAAWQAASQPVYQPAQLQTTPMIEGPRQFQIIGEEGV